MAACKANFCFSSSFAGKASNAGLHSKHNHIDNSSGGCLYPSRLNNPASVVRCPFNHPNLVSHLRSSGNMLWKTQTDMFPALDILSRLIPWLRIRPINSVRTAHDSVYVQAPVFITPACRRASLRSSRPSKCKPRCLFGLLHVDDYMLKQYQHRKQS